MVSLEGNLMLFRTGFALTNVSACFNLICDNSRTTAPLRCTVAAGYLGKCTAKSVFMYERALLLEEKREFQEVLAFVFFNLHSWKVF